MIKSKIIISSWLNRGYIKEVQNAFKNYDLIEHLRKEKKIIPMEDIAHTKKGRAIILGSGSSLDDMIPYLHKWKGAIFCTSSQIDTLIYHRIDPDYLVYVEPFTDKEQGSTPELAVPKDKRWGKTSLICHPSMAHDVLKQWSAETNNLSLIVRLYVASSEWYTTVLYYAYPWIKSIIIPCLTTPPAAMSVASLLGYDPLYLSGLDHGGDRFIKRYYQDDKWHTGSYDKKTKLKPTKKMKTKEGIIVDNSQIFMKKGTVLEIFGDLYHGRTKSIYNLAPPTKSALKEIPYCDPDLPLNGRDPVYTKQVKNETLKNLELYLAFTNIFLIPGNNGMGKGFTNVEIETMKDLEIAVDNKNTELLKNRLYYEKLMQDSGLSLKEMADKGMIPDDGQATVARKINVKAITLVDKDKYMAEAKRIKKLADKKYKSLTYTRYT